MSDTASTPGRSIVPIMASRPYMMREE